MGNRTSSCFNIIQDSRSQKTAKVIDAQGKLRKVKLPLKAAELMLEEPGHIISPLEDLKRTRRVAAMRADDELSGTKVYVLVPIGRVHCRVNDADMEIIEAACTSSSSGKNTRRKISATAKVLPADVAEEDQSQFQILPDKSMTGYRLGSCRPWTPVLEPISEVL